MDGLQKKAIQSGIDNPDSNIGVYVGDPESYTMLASLVDPVIREYHNYDMSGHKSDFSLEGFSLENLDPAGNYVVSTRIRVGRNFAKFRSSDERKNEYFNFTSCFDYQKCR